MVVGVQGGKIFPLPAVHGLLASHRPVCLCLFVAAWGDGASSEAEHPPIACRHLTSVQWLQGELLMLLHLLLLHRGAGPRHAVECELAKLIFWTERR